MALYLPNMPPPTTLINQAPHPDINNLQLSPTSLLRTIIDRNLGLSARLAKIYEPLARSLPTLQKSKEQPPRSSSSTKTSGPPYNLTTRTTHNLPSLGTLESTQDKCHTTATRNTVSLKNTVSPKIKGALINAQSLVAHATEIADLILKEDLDFLAITETWLHPAAGPMLMLAVPDNYSILRQDRPNSRGGGVAIIHKCSLSMRLATSSNVLSCETLSVKVPLTNSQTLNIHLIYRPPGPIGTFDEDLNVILSSNLKSSSQVLTLGDFNLGYNDLGDQTASTIANTLAELGFAQRSMAPTHLKGRILDWVADHNCLAKITNTTPLIWTDHHLVSFLCPLTDPHLCLTPQLLLLSPEIIRILLQKDSSRIYCLHLTHSPITWIQRSWLKNITRLWLPR
ncbi:uncharacterized protein [Ambystoma mexicanum]|uniref:uncharacterized protein isoform X1 n=1 Tax=Ambystoma mexicanum TaxID=8296 RepID=UPI0037E90351